MIRFTWLQSRTQTAAAFGALAIMAVVLAVTGPHLVSLYNASVAGCAAHGNCPAASIAFLRNDGTLRTWLGVLTVVLPGLIGIFWGAPLVARELEAGTFRLAWTQSITRTRWLAVKLGVVGLASMAVAGLVSLMVTWWASPLDRVHMSLFGTFDSRDIVPIGYAAFAFALGVTAGVLIRRPLPAMATTLVAFVGARLAATYWIRPHLIAPLHANIAIGAASIVGYGSDSPGGQSSLQLASPNMPNAWIYSQQLVDKAGQPITAQFVQRTCPGVGGGGGGGPAGGTSAGSGLLGSSGSHTHVSDSAQQAFHDCAVQVTARFHEAVIYQPASRYWTFQWYELAIFLGAALVLAGASIWWARRRLS
jgi:hypothetical protein